MKDKENAMKFIKELKRKTRKRYYGNGNNYGGLERHDKRIRFCNIETLKKIKK
jgi:hypothetical protein